MKNSKKFAKQAQAAQQANSEAQKSAVNTQGNQGGNNIIAAEPVKKAKRAYTVPPVYQVGRRAKALFARQLVQSGETKRQCLAVALQQSNKVYPDALRFWSDFRAERDRLTDSKRFCSECETRGLVPANVADHVVCEGKAVLNKVLKEGLQTLGESVQMFNTPLWKDSFNLYKKEGGDE